jgi:enoyl-CoA hydratase
MTDIVTFEQSDNIAVVTINRPRVRNALNWDAMYALSAAVDRAVESPDLRAIVLTGAGQRAFISGGDLRDLHGKMTQNDGFRQHDVMTVTLDRLAALPMPIIAALNGAARGGGCEVALACDLRVAAEDATLGFAQIGMGVTPGWGGAKRLFELIGYSQAMDLLLTGRVIEAQEALTLGLVNRIAGPGDALAGALALAEEIAAMPPLAARGVKEVLRGHLTLPKDRAVVLERSVFGRLWATADHAEASTAFLEKRSPDFRGK